jgi:hypothetical protein
MVEMKTCLAMLLPQLSFQLAVPAEQITLDAQLTIGMASGLPCFVLRAAEKDDPSSGASTTASMVSECATALSEPSSAASALSAPRRRTTSGLTDPGELTDSGELTTSDPGELNTSSGDDATATGESPEQKGGDPHTENESENKLLLEHEQPPCAEEVGARHCPESRKGGRSRCRSPWQRATGTEAEREAEDDVGFDVGSCSESAPEPADAGDGTLPRRRSRRRRSGRSRTREKRFWRNVRQPTPERELASEMMPVAQLAMAPSANPALQPTAYGPIAFVPSHAYAEA